MIFVGQENDVSADIKTERGSTQEVPGHRSVSCMCLWFLT